MVYIISISLACTIRFGTPGYIFKKYKENNLILRLLQYQSGPTGHPEKIRRVGNTFLSQLSIQTGPQPARRVAEYVKAPTARGQCPHTNTHTGRGGRCGQRPRHSESKSASTLYWRAAGPGDQAGRGSDLAVATGLPRRFSQQLLGGGRFYHSHRPSTERLNDFTLAYIIRVLGCTQ